MYFLGLTREGTKTQLRRKNSHVVFEIDQMLSPQVWRSVLFEGTFQELQGEEREHAMYLIST
ncbi:pyridoxamine 5'-phosphate oxidase family protein [Larkinella knui]|uniref:Uncharacterized protein n=1 Tax=Larkinella knui TaxID=2025310 RepID=A0A3P1CB58_9BACT|nr:hypothetical protein EHT87_30160 [Larkinella knui]